MNTLKMWMVFVPITVALMWVIGTLAGRSGRKVARWLVIAMTGLFAFMLCGMMLTENIGEIIEGFENITGTPTAASVVFVSVTLPILCGLYGHGLYVLTYNAQNKERKILRRAKARAKARAISKKARRLAKEGAKIV